MPDPEPQYVNNALKNNITHRKFSKPINKLIYINRYMRIYFKQTNYFFLQWRLSICHRRSGWSTCLIFEVTINYNSLSKADLASTVGKTEVQLHCPQPAVTLLERFHGGPDKDFAIDTAWEFGCVEFFVLLPTHMPHPKPSKTCTAVQDNGSW